MVTEWSETERDQIKGYTEKDDSIGDLSPSYA